MATPAQSRSQSGSAQASGSAAASGSGSARSNSTTATTSISIPATAAAGGVTVTQPPSTGEASYYKIASGEYITFGWNFTSLYVQPEHLTIIASCSANGNTYPVGPTASPSNTLAANATNVVWSPWEWEQIQGQVPFAEATYVLKMWDQRGPDVGIKGGYLSPYAGTEFALYRPGPYVSIADGWTCSTCNAGFERLSDPLGLAAMLTFASVIFSVWNVWRR
ncbi:hypothetical protein BD324DRAFT_3116 [Kockovaella imperatae]|uniref:DUF7137 domain-containing protein n=1 Tax=Kockovaella imperatae TaxID=4999 RepID=A0A1Y1UQZ7_9TREE|nr:hypothetical protein BD324DRAFT_3116 [Kockovaella imperatae]ORX40480.1 hypothetical protein BD324DRAFT_3116 [Kockovaella imperatae]